MERKLRVLWFSNTPAASDEYVGSNGTGGWLKSLDKAIQDRIELHVAFYSKSGDSDFIVGKTTYHTFSALGLKGIYRRVKALMGGESQFTKRWRRIIEEVNPDLIHVHGTELGFIEVAKLTDIPVVLSIQAILQSMTYKYFGDFKLNDLGFFYLFSKYYRSYRHFLRVAKTELKYVPLLKYVIGRTEWDRRCFSILAPHAKYFKNNEVLREGFYVNKWKEHAPIDDKFIIFTTTGKLLFKGLETLCYALTELNRTGINVEWHIAGIREDDEIVKVTMRNLKHLFPKQGLHFLGALSEEKLIEEMLKAHVFAYPTHQDNSSNALCEAMILGMPCVSTFAGGSGSMLSDNKNGIMVQDGEPWAFAGAIKELLLDRNLAAKYGNQARKDASERHNIDTITGDLINIYRNCVK